jgi:hypothetical protein
LALRIHKELGTTYPDHKEAKTMTDLDKRLDAMNVMPQPPNTRVTKVIVAVHGIGDQFNYATVQTVTRRFLSFLGLSTGIPLGTFHATQVGQTGALLLQSPNFPPGFDHLGFAEVYWADVPRELVKKGYTIEESKAWARTIVERLQFRCADRGLSDLEYEKVISVLQETIETLAVLDRLCFLAEKAGLFKFDLKKILEDYLGDVQIVTEFEDSRKKILTQFDKVFATVAEHYPKADIYIVAHSEGTVVSFFGLLTALCKHTKDAKDGSQWIEKVRGYMTIGSPIDKHLILWPGLWDQFKPRYRPTPAIEWRNYYDFGDPIGFELNTAREWMKKQGLEKAFVFRDGLDDKGFYRYWFPGKAHTDYWADEQLFGHFIETVVKESPGKKNGDAPTFKNPPGSKSWPRLTTKAIPYFIVGALMFLAVYILYKAIGTAMPPPPQSREQASTILRNVFGLSSLLLGVTLMARLPRLSSLKWGIPLDAIGFTVCAAIYNFLVPFRDPNNRFDKYADDKVGAVAGHLPLHIASLIVLAILVVIVVYTLNHVFPKLGLYTLLLPGLVVVIGMIVGRVIQIRNSVPNQESKPLWPVLLALAGFLYLWWLATLLLDLVLIWHGYIRNSLAMDRLRALAGWEEMSKKRRNKGKPRAAAHTPAAPTQ